MDTFSHLYEENMNLHDRMVELQARLKMMSDARHDLANMCARASD